MPSLFLRLSDQAHADLRALAATDVGAIHSTSVSTTTDGISVLLRDALLGESESIRAPAMLKACAIWDSCVKRGDKSACDEFVASLAQFLEISGHPSEATASAAWITTVAALAKSSFALAELERMRR